MARLFFAIQLSDAWKKLIANRIEKFRHLPWAKTLRWTKTENLHLTLRFIGESDEARLASLIQHISPIIKNIIPFSIHASLIQFFPSPHNPHVFAIIVPPSTDLFQLQNEVEKTIKLSGFTADSRAFLPHITLAHCTSKKIKLPGKLLLSLPPFTVDQIVLINSEESDGQRNYTPLKHFHMDTLSENKITQPRVTVGAIVTKENKILLVKRKRPPHQGCWAIPGGKIELGETLQQAAEREIKEETGITICAKDPIYIFDYIERDESGDIRFHYVIIDVAADYLSGDLQSGDDAEMVDWFTIDEAEKLPLTLSTQKLLKEKSGIFH